MDKTNDIEVFRREEEIMGYSKSKNRFRFTDKKISSLKAENPGEGGREVFWDTIFPAFGLRVYISGRKAWTIIFRSDPKSEKGKRITFGTFPSIKTKEARQMARDICRTRYFNKANYVLSKLKVTRR